MTKQEAHNMIEKLPFGRESGAYYGSLDLINKIYANFEIEKEALKKEYYILGSNANFEAMVNTGKVII